MTSALVSACCWLWLVLNILLCASKVYAAHSLSVLDSQLLRLYQNYRQPYDVIEPGFAADPEGYELRNSYRPAAKSSKKNTYKAGPDDGGYHTRTVPIYPKERHYHHHHDPGGYATQNAYHKPPPVEEGYHTKTVDFPLYQEYHVDVQPGGYATQNTYHPYRSGKQHEHYDGYNTRTSEARWLPLYQDYQHPHDPGGYATQNAFHRPHHPYRSSGPPSKVGHVTAPRENSENVKDNSFSADDEDRTVHRKFYPKDDRNFDDYDDDDDASTGDWPRQPGPPAPDRPTHYYEYSTNSFDHRPTEEQWRSAVGPRPQINFDMLPTPPTITLKNQRRHRHRHEHRGTAPPRFSKLDITIDRFGQEEDVTGASFSEPITYDRQTPARTSEAAHQLSRSLSKQSDTAAAAAAQLDNSFSKFGGPQSPPSPPSIVDNIVVTSADPCMSLPDGDYPLDERFVTLLPHIDARCNFIKCAHRATHVNPCSTGTRNPDHQLGLSGADPLTTGAHYCSVRDVESFCQNQYYHQPGDIQVNTPDYGEELINNNVKRYNIV